MNNQIEVRKFSHNEKEFEVKLFGETDTYTVIAYLDERPISVSYTVSLENHIDYFQQHKSSIIEQLFDLAEAVIRNDIYYRG
jgi:hypothetical protein